MKIKVYQIDQDSDRNRVGFMGYDFTMQHGGVNPSVYKTVFDGRVDCDDLEEIFSLFNSGSRPPTLFGHSLSVSDVVEIQGEIKEQYGRIDVLYKDKNGIGQVGDSFVLTSKEDFEREIDEYGLGSISATCLADKHLPTVEPGIYFCDSIGYKKLEDFDTEQCQPLTGHRMLVVEPHKAPYEATVPDDYRAIQQAVFGNFECVYPFDDNSFLYCNDEGKLNGMEGNRKIGGDIIAGTFLIAGDDGGGGTTDLTDDQLRKYGKMFEADESYSKDEVQNNTFFRVIGFD